MFFKHSHKTACIILFISGCFILLIPAIACGNWMYNAISFLVLYPGYPNVGYEENRLWVGILAGAISFAVFTVFWHEVTVLLYKALSSLRNDSDLTAGN